MKPTINKILLPLYTIAEQWFTISLSQFSEELTNHFIATAEKSNSVTVQSDYFAALYSLQKSSKETIPKFITSLGESFQTSKKNDAPIKNLSDSSFANSNNKSVLNLIATKDWEENLSFDTAVDNIKKQNREAFEHLEIRIIALLKKHNETIAKNPLDPENILDAFRASMESLDFSPEVRIQVYQYFEKFLSGHIAELLEKLNTTLKNQGILPEITTDYSIKKQKDDSPNSLQKQAEKAIIKRTEPEQSVHQEPQSHYPGEVNVAISEPQIHNNSSMNTPSMNIGSNMTEGRTTSPGTAFRQQTSSLNSRYSDLARQLSEAKITHAATETQTITTPPAQLNSDAQLNSGERINENIPEEIHAPPLLEAKTKPDNTLNKLLGYTNRPVTNSDAYANNNLSSLKQIYADKQQTLSGSGTAAFSNEYITSTQELVDALVDIQDNSSTLSVHNQIKGTILKCIDKSPETTQLKNNNLYLIDMIEDLFTQIAENKKLSSSAKELFRRLMIPIIHLALVDETFIDNKNHTARLFLDDFADASLGITNSETKLNNPVYLKLKKLSVQIGQENKINKSIFSKHHKDLKRFINYRKHLANSSSHTPGASEKKKINAIVKHCIGDNQLPEGITIILNKIWKNVMFKIYLDVNSNNDDKERATAFISSLIFSINRAKNSIEKNRLERLIPVINNDFEDGLILINCPFSTKEKLTRYLENIHHTALGITHKKDDPASDIETDKIVYRNELFEETEASDDTKSIADDLNSFEDTINTIVPEKIVSSLEEAFCEADKVEVINIENEQAETSSINQHRVNTPEKQSRTDFELIRLVNNSYKMTVINDGYTSKVKSISEDSWLEFRFKTHFSRARVTWIADDKSQFNCLTQNDRVIEISLEALSDSFRQGICSMIQSSSVIDEAIKAVSDKASSKEQVIQ